jgi:hypothetical protein
MNDFSIPNNGELHREKRCDEKPATEIKEDEIKISRDTLNFTTNFILSCLDFPS